MHQSVTKNATEVDGGAVVPTMMDRLRWGAQRFPIPALELPAAN